MDNIFNLPKNKEIVLVAHSGTFHADDVFSSAILGLVLERLGCKYKILRSRDPEVINSADIVYDVGRIYDFEAKRFDHHQVDKSLERDGVPYSSFGLVWRHFGMFICENNVELWKAIDEKLVKVIDCSDNGITTYNTITTLRPITLPSVINDYNPTWVERGVGEEKVCELFFKAVDFARSYFNRVYTSLKQDVEDTGFVKEIYNKTDDKRIIVLDKMYYYREALVPHKEVMIIVKGEGDNWAAKAMKDTDDGFEYRFYYPESWRGLEGEALEAETGVKGAWFCHKGGFLCVGKSKEAAIKLAEKALESKGI